MKYFTLLTMGFFILAGTYAFGHTINSDHSTWNKKSSTFLNDTLVETNSYFANGAIQTRSKTYFDNQGMEAKKIEESFRKNGSRKYVVVMIDQVYKHYYARYNKHDEVIFEKEYTYNFQGTLLSIKTTKNGIVSTKDFAADVEGNAVYAN